MCIPSKPESKTFDEILKLLNTHVKPTLSDFVCRELFYESKKISNESPREWAARLRNLVSTCSFRGEAEIERALIDRFIIAYDKGVVRDQLFEEKKIHFFLNRGNCWIQIRYAATFITF